MPPLKADTGGGHAEKRGVAYNARVLEVFVGSRRGDHRGRRSRRVWRCAKPGLTGRFHVCGELGAAGAFLKGVEDGAAALDGGTR